MDSKLVCWTDLVGLSFPHVWAKRNVSFMKKYSSNKAFWFRKTNKLITCLFVYLFGRGQILPPSSSELPPEPPTLMAFLNSSSNFTLFRQYALVRNLSLSCQNSSLSFFSQCDLVCVCVFLHRCTICQMFGWVQLISPSCCQQMMQSGSTSTGPTPPYW